MVNDRLSELFDSRKEKIENIERVRPNPLPRFRTTGNHKTPDLPFYTPKDPKTPDKERERERARAKKQEQPTVGKQSRIEIPQFPSRC
jgi:hypothetical protein